MNRYRQYFRTGLIAAVLGVVIGAGSTTAFAASAFGSWWTYGPLLGIDYQNRAAVTVFSDGSGATARTYEQTADASNVPVGYMGVQARLYNGSGNLMESTAWYYNEVACAGYTVATVKSTNHGYYYSTGVTRAYNGNGYDSYYTYQSPTLHNPL